MAIRAFLFASLSLSLTSGAFAADLPQQALPFGDPPAPNAFTWTGFYAGVNAGYITNGSDVPLTTIIPPASLAAKNYLTPYMAKIDDDGFSGGAQIGYNFRFQGTGLLVGAEADAAYTGIDHVMNSPDVNGAHRLFRSSLNYLGTLRGRLGYALDRVLIYGTGGLAYGGMSSQVALVGLPDNVTTRFGGSQSGLQTGVVYGGGIEYALGVKPWFNVLLANAVTVKLEYLRYDLGTVTVRAEPNPATTATGTYDAHFKSSGNLVRAGLNYAF